MQLFMLSLAGKVGTELPFIVSCNAGRSDAEQSSRQRVYNNWKAVLLSLNCDAHTKVATGSKIWSGLI